ncbi:DNA-processing protein DprA [Vreelandella boliviensis]|uniref:DNA-protecting protein DprA n=1 Tax=Vreelandella boliviensis LC1 TaxID=1072583 RepID=A0A265E2K3_9GAMM|nr:DNA-processing protein DprA [Halomonas boliviensis]EHJ93672.1 Protein smf [Halomonas boliviensis LC1]OZT75822.1 DNA-protecting protein DprA [Halomonas boliviensis LC1]
MDAQAWLVINALPSMGALRIAQLLARQPQWPEGWLAALPSRAASELRLWLEHPTRSPLQKVIDETQAWQQSGPSRHVLHRDHPAWPALLNELPDPPVVLWAQGDLGALEGPKLAMVGTRRPTGEGTHNAQTFARDLAYRGWCVVSGMALGVDGVAQRAALNAKGRTIGVLGCGVDVIYPASNRDLYDQLGRLPGGLLLSEHPPGTRARPAFFPRRNRIVTGLSLGTLVVEATEKSGSLVSARLTLEQNRELFVLPGSLHNVQARGCLALLRQGSTHLACSVDDIITDLGHWAEAFIPPDAAIQQPLWETAEKSTKEEPLPESLPDSLLTSLSATPTPIDTLVASTGTSVSDCQQRLLMLELEGWVSQQAGGWVRLPRP